LETSSWIGVGSNLDGTGSITATAGLSVAGSESSFSVLRKPVSGRDLALRMAMLLARSDSGRR
jgi:hypothetical protein